MNKWKALIIGAAFALMTGGATLAAGTHSTTNSAKNSTTHAQATVHYEAGTVNSISNSDLVLARSYKGKTQDVKFVMDSNTKKDGTITRGEHVRVYFKDQNNQRIATEVKPEPTKSASTKPASTKSASTKSAPTKS